MICVNSYYIDKHIKELDAQESLLEQINKRVAKLMEKGNAFYPYDRENIFEALGGLTDSQERVLQHALEQGFNEIGGMLANWIEQYWAQQAEIKAAQELSDDILR